MTSVIGKDGVGGSIPLGGTIFPYKSIARQERGNANCCVQFQNIPHGVGMDVGILLLSCSRTGRVWIIVPECQPHPSPSSTRPSPEL
jgi:hypothetical protein